MAGGAGVRMVYATIMERRKDIDELGLRPEEAAVEEMRQMAGCVLKYPESEDVERFVMESRIGASLRRDASPENAARVSEVFGLPRRATSKVFARNNDGRGLAAERERRLPRSTHVRPRTRRGRMFVCI